MPGTIAAIASHLPEGTLTNADLTAQFPEWSVDKIAAKTGIMQRHVVADGQYTSDLAIAAGRALFDEHDVDPASIDFLIVCSQTPDFVLPSMSLLVQAGLGLRTDAGATDITLGCSGYVYALGLASALIDSHQAERVLVVTADTYTRLLNPSDKSVRTLFGDGATATLVVATERGGLGPFVYGSDGSGAGSLIVPNGGLRPGADFPKADPTARGLVSNGYDLFMDGPEIFNFTLRVAGETVDRLLAKSGLAMDDIDEWVLHQANAYMLEHLRKKLHIPADRFVIEIADVGNTVSSTIPIALGRRLAARDRRPGFRSVLLGFGVGLSWGATVVEW